MKHRVWSRWMLIGLLSALVLSLAGLFYAPTVAARASGPLSDAEIQGILYMREEEKLARDVYNLLYDKWGRLVFDNISQSEQSHMDAIKTLIDRYGLVDPAAKTAPGEFANTDLQALYDDLIVQGDASLPAALAVGALIEEVDIIDLQEYLANTTHSDITQVYGNLLNGSHNHLRAFVSQLARFGVTYTPVYLDQATYDQIIAGGSSGGRRGHRWGS